jgi:hypothetical protein
VATVDEATEAAGRGQAAIDRAAEALDRFNALTDAWERVDSSDPADEHSDLLAGAEAVVALSGAADMVALDQEGAKLFARITDGAVAAPSGLGLRLQLLDLAIEASMDPTRFWQTARSVYQLLVNQDAALRGLFGDPDWRADLVGLSLEVRDAGFESAAVAAAAGDNRRRLIQSALRLAARQIERAAHPILATLLAVERRQPYGRERRRDINSLLTRVSQSGHEALLLGLDPKLRDADAHGAFEIDHEGVRLTGSRGTVNYLSDEELIDFVLAGTESIVAVYWGLVAALVAAGVDIEELEEAIAAEVADSDKIKFILLLNGWHDVEVDIADSHVTARGQRDRESQWGLIGAVVSVVPEACETLTLIAIDENGTHTASGTLSPFRRWSDGSDAEEKEIAFTLASMAWRIDGSPILSRAHTEKVYAYRAVEALNPDVSTPEALTRLRALLDASRAISSNELEVALAAALRLRREIATGTPGAANVNDVITAFDRWLIEDLGPTRLLW